MRTHRGFSAILQSAVASLFLLGCLAVGQTARPTAPARSTDPESSAKQSQQLQEQLLDIVRKSPTLAEVVAHDPSLLSNPEYVKRNNPELASFLQEHPEVSQNPDYYLFNNLRGENEPPSQTLERKLWPERNHYDAGSEVNIRLINDGLPFLGVLAAMGAFLWLVQVLLENRRWGRIFKLQSDVHGKLIERFGTSQEVLTYMSTDAGKRFLEATPISVGLDRGAPVPSPVAKVLTPLQIGIVMSLLGIGLLSLRHSLPEAASGLMVVGTVIMMPGLGFIISAGVTWFLAQHLGLMPKQGEYQQGQQQ